MTDIAWRAWEREGAFFANEQAAVSIGVKRLPRGIEAMAETLGKIWEFSGVKFFVHERDSGLLSVSTYMSTGREPPPLLTEDVHDVVTWTMEREELEEFWKRVRDDIAPRPDFDRDVDDGYVLSEFGVHIRPQRGDKDRFLERILDEQQPRLDLSLSTSPLFVPEHLLFPVYTFDYDNSNHESYITGAFVNDKAVDVIDVRRHMSMGYPGL